MSNLKLIPLSTGRFLGAEKSNFTYAVDQGIKIQSPILMWFIDGARHKILVDTGVSDPEWAARYHHPIERKPHEDPINAIESLGLRASDIDIIINTHLHWDHCFNNHLFPNARILVQAEELRYAISPLPCHAHYYESQLIGMTPSWLKALDRVEAVEGEMEVEKGINLLPLPGHTNGFQAVVLDLPSGRFIIASDTCPLYENWEGNDQADHIPPGIHVDLSDYYRSIKKIESLEATVLPGHDMKVLEREYYA